MPKDKTPFRIKLARSIAGKSFIPNLDLHDRLMSGNGANVINDFNTKLAQLEGNLGWVAAANEAIVQGIIGVPIRLYRKETDGTRTEIFKHDLLDLIASPNAVHRYKQFADLHHTYVNLTGEGYILMLDRAGQPFEPKKGALPSSLHILPAHGTELKLGTTYYESVVRFNNKEYPITSVIRDLVPDPLDPYRGRSIIAAAAKTIDTDEQMKDWNRRFFANNARPGLVFSTNEELSDEAYRRWKEQFSEEHTGAANAYKNLLIEGGSVQPYMMNQHDLDFLASRKYSRDEILAMMRVSPSMLGMVENVNKANNDGALEIHHKLNTIPRLDRFLDLLNAVLVTPYDRNYEFDFESPVPEDKESKLKEAEGGVNKWMTIDEVRALYGMDPLPNGDGNQLYVQGIMTPLKAISSPSKPAKVDETKAVASQAQTANAAPYVQKQLSARDVPGLYDDLDIDPSNLGCIMLDTELLDVRKHVEDADDDLFIKDGWGDGAAAETEAHVTLLYGLLENGNTWKDKVDAVLKGWSLASVKVDEVGFFDLGDSYAIIAHIEKTPELIDGHERLTLLPHIQTFSEYKPHLTLAYVKYEQATVDKWVEALGAQYNGKTIKTRAINYGDLPEEVDHKEGEKSLPKPKS